MIDNNMALFIILYIVAVFISAVSQLMLKISAKRTYSSTKAEYLNTLVIIAYLLFFLTTLITVSAYRVLPLSLGPVLESLGYVFVAVLGFFVLKERITKKALGGMALIIVGAILASV